MSVGGSIPRVHKSSKRTPKDLSSSETQYPTQDFFTNKKMKDVPTDETI
jgi:hypothetical protein